MKVMSLVTGIATEVVMRLIKRGRFLHCPKCGQRVFKGRGRNRG